MDEQRLQRLLGELEYHRKTMGARYTEHHEKVRSNTRATLIDAPLVHGLARTADMESVLASGRLLSRARRQPSRPMRSEQQLGIPPSVYTTAGVFYPNRQVAIVLKASIEEGTKAQASPWDSGHFFHTQRGRLRSASLRQRKKRFRDHTLSTPYYREYFVAYVATCFASPGDYVASKPHVHEDPLGVLDDRVFVSRVFEVRFEDDLPLIPRDVLAIFLPANRKRNVSGELHQHLEQLRGHGVKVRYYPSAKKELRRGVRKWLLRHLGIDHTTP